MSDLAALLRVFSYLSLVTFGGGMAAYPALKASAVDVHRWVTLEELDHLYSVGQLAPGPNMMMIVTLGVLTSGPAGAVVVFLAFFGPNAFVAWSVGRLWTRLEGRQWVNVLHRGLAPVSIGLLLAGCLTFAKGALTSWVTAIIGATVFTVLVRTKINPALLVLAAAVAGILAIRAS